MAQWVKHVILDFSSGRDLMTSRDLCEVGHCVRLCAEIAEPAWNSVSPFLPLLTPHLCSLLSLKEEGGGKGEGEEEGEEKKEEEEVEGGEGRRRRKMK